MKRVNFVLNALDGHSYKRIEEFIELGFEVKVYGFDRGLNKQYEGIDTIVLGTFPNSMPYMKRVRLIFIELKKLFKNTQSGDTDLWYYFGLQMALFCCTLNKNKKYFYEESDMTHLSLRCRLLRNALERKNKRIINNSLLSVFTSEGFLQYHFKKEQYYPLNVVVMPNKIHANILKYPVIANKTLNVSRIRFAFVGYIRYQAVYNMAYFISKNFSHHEFHFYGEIQSSCNIEKYAQLNQFENVFFHGFFKNPEELPFVYSNIDVVISTYDVSSINVRYAEPNKLYESIYFRTPIIVSEGTFLARQVERYHTGWAVNAFDETAVCNLVNRIENELECLTKDMTGIPQSIGVDSCVPLKDKLSSLSF